MHRRIDADALIHELTQCSRFYNKLREARDFAYDAHMQGTGGYSETAWRRFLKTERKLLELHSFIVRCVRQSPHVLADVHAICGRADK